jgi:predicted PurR-regulated permease PerM
MISARLPQIRAWLRARVPAVWQEKYAPHLKSLKGSLGGWFFAQLKLVGVTFAVLAGGFFLLQMEHPFLWAVVICFVDILPILGTGTVLIPWSIVCFLQGDTLRAVGLLALYGAISLLRSVLQPRLVGKELGLDPLVTLLAIYAGYQLWGLLGMVLAPVLAALVAQIVRPAEKRG